MPFDRRRGGSLMLMRFKSYFARVEDTAPLIWLRMRETTGTTAVNAGSGGATLNGTISGAITLGQIGKLGANDAFDYATSSDGAITIPNHASWAGAASYTYAALMLPRTGGG